MGTFGTRLRREREKRGLRLVDVARDTKVAIHYLTALEYEDLDSLPDDDLARRHLRSYAEHLGIDTATLDAELEGVLETRPSAASRPDEIADADETPVPSVPPVLEEDPGAEETPAASIPESPGETADVPAEHQAEDDAEEPRILPVTVPTIDDKREGSRVKPIMLTVAAIVLVIVLIWILSSWLGGEAGEPSAAGTAAGVDPVVASEKEVDNPMELDQPSTEVAAPGPRGDESPVKIETDSDRNTASTRSAPDRQPASKITVIAHGAGTGVVDRMLVGEGSRFTVGDQVWFWTRLRDGTVGETIRHVWYHEGKVMDRVSLRVGGWHWRTQSRKTLLPGSEGRWTVEAVGEAGRVIARSEFLCVSPAETE